MKAWGKGEFWGLGSEYDPDWVLTESQKKLRQDLMELCRTKIRPNAVHCDRTYTFPKESIDAVAELGLLALIIPKEFGGLGESHLCLSMVMETLARYGCPPTAMILGMHSVTVATLLLRYHNNPHIQQLLARIAKEKLLGGISASDPATGGHDWFQLSSKSRYLNEQTIQLLKFGSWATSAGFADFYTIFASSPDFDGNFNNNSMYLVYKDEIRAFSDSWSALGMHGNMSGPLIVEGKFDLERMVGPPGDGRKSIDEVIEPFFLVVMASVWNGIALALMDLAKKHVTRTALGDVGIRVCDYPTIQDYFGDSLIETTSSRCTISFLVQALDQATKNNNWSVHSDLNTVPRSSYVPWLWQAKYTASKNVSVVADRMLWACGGEGYKTELGLERLFRDGKAGWVMAPSNEFIRNTMGVTVLNGFSAIDLWEETANERLMHREMRKLTAEQKEEVGRQLLKEAEQELRGSGPKHPYQDTDFNNPFNTAPPSVVAQEIKTTDGTVHKPALKPDFWTALSLASRKDMTDKMTSFRFSLPNATDHTGCLTGQYVSIKVTIEGKEHLRYFSPVSRPDDYGNLELVLRFESQGTISNHFKTLKPGDKVEMQGPSGGFEYTANQVDEMTLLASGGGITPGLQIIRSIVHDPDDATRVTLLYHADTEEEILYRTELDGYANNDKRVRVVYTLSEAGEGWQGEEGFIHTQMIDRYVTKPNGLKHKVVMCGGPRMCVSCLYSLRALGFSSDSIFVYGQFGLQQVKAVYGKNTPPSSHRCAGIL